MFARLMYSFLSKIMLFAVFLTAVVGFCAVHQITDSFPDTHTHDKNIAELSIVQDSHVGDAYCQDTPPSVDDYTITNLGHQIVQRISGALIGGFDSFLPIDHIGIERNDKLNIYKSVTPTDPGRLILRC